jgi:tyrosyl-tRNA synthetase
MSKSLGNYIGIDEEANQIFGKVMSIPDELIVRYYRLATEVGDEDIKRIEDSLKAGSENPKNLKADLAAEIVRIYQGDDQARAAREEFERRFGSKRGTLDLEGVEEVALAVEGDAVWIVNLLRDAGLVKSGGEARRKIAAGAVRIDGDKITDPAFEVPFEAGKEMILRLGREFRKIVLKR